MGSPSPLARAAALAAGLIALSTAPAAGAGGAGFGDPRSLTRVNGYVAAPAIAADGRAAVAVTDFSTGRSRVLLHERSARGRWRPARALRTSRQELFEPAAAFTSDGTGVFTWLRARRIDQDQVLETRRVAPGGALGPVERLSPPGERAIFPQVAPGAGSQALIGWEDGDYSLHAGGDTVFASRQFSYSLALLPDGTAVALGHALGAGGVQVRTRPPGGDWSTPVTLSGERTAREPVLATGADGTVAVAWAQLTSAGYRVQVSVRPPGGEFSAARAVAAGEGEARAPGLAVRADGSVLLAWLGGAQLGFLARGSEVRLATLSRAGGLSAPRRVSRPGRRISAAPRVFADAQGEALVAWEESRRLVAATRSAGGRLTVPRAVSGPRIFAARVVANARGQALAAWAVEHPRGRGQALIQVAELGF